MTYPRNIMIDFGLFTDMVRFVLDHGDLDDYDYNLIMDRVQDKIEALVRRDLYSKYKSGATAEERSAARREYLEEIGLSDPFRWTDDQDINVTHPARLSC